jgi:hypothetical protein
MITSRCFGLFCARAITSFCALILVVAALGRCAPDNERQPPIAISTAHPPNIADSDNASPPATSTPTATPVSRATRTPNPKKEPATPVSPPAEVASSQYLPLGVGNAWVYKKTVLRPVFAWEAYQKTDDIKVMLVLGISPSLTTGEYEETIRVKNKVEDNGLELWEIEVSAQTVRDGRYGGLFIPPHQILWGRVPSSEHVIEIGEILINQSFFEGERRHTRTLLAEPPAEHVQILLQPSGLPVTYITSPNRVDVEVTAGRFCCALEMIMEIEDTEQGRTWSTYSYYVPEVGLVKEFQKDDAGHMTYLFELIEYEVN